MRAIRYHGREDVRHDDIEEPVYGDDEVLLKVLYNGLCGTDVHEYFHSPLVASHNPIR